MRNLEREIGKVLRHAAVRIAEGERPSRSASSRDDLPRDSRRRRASRTRWPCAPACPGVATGLAWTPVGGDILFIEATRMPGSGKLILTGQLGDVMRESAQAALSIVKNRAPSLGIESQALFEKNDIHIHVPAGAPGCLVATQPKHPLQAQGTDAVLLAGDEPHRQEPHPQRLARPLEDGAGRQRRLSSTCPAVKHLTRRYPRLPNRSASPANEPLRPTQPPDVVPASRLGAEPRIHLLERPRVINPWDRVSPIFHPPTLPDVLTWAKGIPTFTDIIAADGRKPGILVGAWRASNRAVHYNFLQIVGRPRIMPVTNDGYSWSRTSLGSRSTPRCSGERQGHAEPPAQA